METRWQGTASAPPQTDSDAFAANFRTVAPALYDFLSRLSGREAAATALMRQVASQAAMGARSADQWPSARAWLFARAYDALPQTTDAATADPAPYIAPDPALLPPVPPESGLEDMTRAVWRAISALPVDQHTLLHLHSREAMVGGEAASVLGITEREANERLQRLIPAVEAASRALFLIRFGRPRDPELDGLLAEMNITRLTPEARARIEEYAERSPTAHAMLAAIPPPLTVYAALQPVPPPAAIAEEAIVSALPWLPVVEEPTTPIAEQTTALPATPEENDAAAPTGMTPAVEEWEYGAAAPAEGEYQGTRALDIPVRQRVVREEAVYVPPRPSSRSLGPLALLGLLGGALILIVGALVLFLVRGDTNGSKVRVTATVGVPTATNTAALSPALATATALAASLGTGTPTPLPTATTAPLPVAPANNGTPTALNGSAVATNAVTPLPRASEIAPTDATGTPIDTPVPRVTPIPRESPTPRVTPVPTNTAEPTAPRATPTHTAAAPTAKPTTAGTTQSGGTLTLDKSSVNLGGSGTSGAVTLGNPGPAAVSYTTKSSTTWLSASPASGSVPAGGNLPVTVSITRAGLAPGTYSGTVTFTTPSGSVSAVTVTFTV